MILVVQVIEYVNLEQIQSLVSELRQYPVDVTSPNITDYNNLFSRSTLNISNEIKYLFTRHHYLIIRNFSVYANDAISLARLLSDRLFYQGNDLKYVHQFETQPFQKEIFSSSLECGAFHTDFWSIKDTPSYIIIQCVEPDPKHPYYSRNQVALVSEILSHVERLLPGSAKTLMNCTLPHRVKDRTTWVKLLSYHENNLMIRLHPKYVDEKALESKHYIENIPIHKLISDIAQSIADDFVLNRGDILIVSNKFCLHRRGEATVIFRETLSKWEGRKVNTLRFF